MAPAVNNVPEDPAKTSPKIKAVGVSGTALTGLLLVLAAALTAIPQEAFSPLGVWALPAASAVATAVNVISGYVKGDPAREPTVVTETVVAAPVAEPDWLEVTEVGDVVETIDTDTGIKTTREKLVEPDATAAVHENDPVVHSDPVAQLAAVVRDPREYLRSWFED